MQLLQPFAGRSPQNEPEFQALTLQLRRMGHILEQSPMNIASRLRQPPGRNYLGAEVQEAFMAGEAAPVDPWTAPGGDPWSQGPAVGASSPQWNATPANTTWGAPAQPAFPASDAVIIDSGTDTDTKSSIGEEEFDNSDLHGMTPAEVDEHLFWAYQRSKSR